MPHARNRIKWLGRDENRKDMWVHLDTGKKFTGSLAEAIKFLTAD